MVAKRVLVRAVTTGLLQFGVTPIASRIRLVLHAGATVLAENDSWSTSPDAAALAAAAREAGAFALHTTSLDCALLLNLPPGTYSAQVANTGTTPGAALIEVYELP